MSGSRWPGIRKLLFGLAVTAGGIALAWAEAPDLWHDAGIRAHPRVIEDFALTDGRCRNRKGLATCSAHVAYDVEGAHFERKVEVSYFSLDLDDREVGLVVDARDPAHATFDIGIEKFWNRVIAALVLVGCLLGGGLVLLYEGWDLARSPSRFT